MRSASHRSAPPGSRTWTRRALSALAVAAVIAAGAAHADVPDLRPGQGSGGAGIGFLANTPDGPEFGLMAYADYFLASRLSVGPLVQYGGVGNDVVVALSVQVKYWWSLLASGRARLVIQAGIGAIGADIEDADTGATTSDASFVVPLGIGIDYAVTPRVALTADLIVNATALGEVVSVGGRDVDLRTSVIPAVFLGVRF